MYLHEKDGFIVSDTIRLPLTISYERRKNSRISIGKKGVYIRLPHTLTAEEKKKQIKKFIDWAKQKLEKNKEHIEKHLQSGSGKCYRDGDRLKINNETYILRVTYKDKKTSSACLTGHEIRLSLSSQLSDKEKAGHCATLLSRCIAKKRLPALKKRIMELNKKHFNMNVGGIAFKYNKSNWGSCSAKGNINISTRLLFAPDRVLDYVCIHELAHLIEKNHSRRFWALVERALPDYKERKMWLKENHERCWF